MSPPSSPVPLTAHSSELKRRKRARWLSLCGILALALLLRLFKLNTQSVWYDEIFSLTVSHQSFHSMMQLLVKDIVQPPLHYIVLHIWFGLVGFGPYQARLLSMAFGTLSVLITYLLGEYLFDRRTGVISGLLLSVSQLGVMYSQEARPYAQILFLVPCCSYVFLVALRTGRRTTWWLFVGTAVLVVYTHYYGFFAIAALLVFALIYRKHYPVSLARWIAAAVLAVLLYLPWLTSGIISEWTHSSKTLSHTPTRVHLPLWTVFSALNTFNNGRPSGVLDASPWWTFIIGSLLFVIPAVLALKLLLQRVQDESGGRQRENLTFILLLFGVPFISGLALGFKSGVYNIRYVMFVAAPYYILVARGISALNSAVLRNILAAGCVVYSVHSLKANYYISYKEDYRGAYAKLASAHGPGDCYAATPPWEERQISWAWAIYEANQPALELVPLDAAASGRQSCQRIWLISVMYRLTPPALARREEARQKLVERYDRIEEKHFFWIDLDLYCPKQR